MELVNFLFLSMEICKIVFVKNHIDCTHKCSELTLKLCLNFLFLETRSSNNKTKFSNCAPLLADLLKHSYDAEFFSKVCTRKNKTLALALNATFRYIDDVTTVTFTLMLTHCIRVSVK